MELKQLKFFVTVAECENVNRAAEKLNIAQSALSRQIQGLEYQLRLKLFDRNGKHIKLSEDGAVFLDEARAVIARVEAARQKARMLEVGATGRLRIGFHQVAGRHSIIPKACHIFRKERPEIALELIPLAAQQQFSKLRRNEIDAAICHNVRPNTGFNELRILTDRWVLAMPDTHRLARHGQISLDELRDEEFVSFNVSTAPLHIEQLERELRRNIFTPNTVQEVSEESIMLDFISLGMGIGFVMDTGYRPANVVLKSVEDFHLSNDLCLTWEEGNSNRGLDSFVEIVKQLVDKKDVGDPADALGGLPIDA